MSLEEVWGAGLDGHWRPTNTLQSSRLGRSGRARGQRQTVHARNICSPGQMLTKPCCRRNSREASMSVQVGRWNFDGKPVDLDYLGKIKPLLALYGPDAARCYSAGNVGILYHTLHSTKQSRHETQPQIE